MSKSLTRDEYLKLAESTDQEWKRNFFLKMAAQLELKTDARST